MYNPGDELPPALARRLWSAFGDRIATFGPHGTRLDDPVRGDVNHVTSASADWRAEHRSDDPHTCETCGATFATDAAYHGRQAIHAVDGGADDGANATGETETAVADGGPSNRGEDA